MRPVHKPKYVHRLVIVTVPAGMQARGVTAALVPEQVIGELAVTMVPAHTAAGVLVTKHLRRQYRRMYLVH